MLETCTTSIVKIGASFLSKFYLSETTHTHTKKKHDFKDSLFYPPPPKKKKKKTDCFSPCSPRGCFCFTCVVILCFVVLFLAGVHKTLKEKKLIMIFINLVKTGKHGPIVQYLYCLCQKTGDDIFLLESSPTLPLKKAGAIVYVTGRSSPGKDASHVFLES